MEFITETIKTPVKGKYDVIIVGAGPSGCGAARACGEKGLKTLILDRFNCLGGAWTIGFMNPLFDHANKNGFIKELKDRLKEKNKWGGFANMSFSQIVAVAAASATDTHKSDLHIYILFFF